MHKADFDRHDLVKWAINGTNAFKDQGVDWIIKSDMDYIMIDFIGDHIDDVPKFDQALWDRPTLYVYFDVTYKEEIATACLKYNDIFEFQEMTVNSYEEDQILLKVGRK